MHPFIDKIFAFGYYDSNAPKGLDAWEPSDRYYAQFVNVLPAWLSAVSSLALSADGTSYRDELIAHVAAIKDDGRAIAEKLNIAVQLRDSNWSRLIPIFPAPWDQAAVQADFERIELATAIVLRDAGLL